MATNESTATDRDQGFLCPLLLSQISNAAMGTFQRNPLLSPYQRYRELGVLRGDCAMRLEVPCEKHRCLPVRRIRSAFRCLRYSQLRQTLRQRMDNHTPTFHSLQRQFVAIFLLPSRTTQGEVNERLKICADNSGNHAGLGR